MWQVRPSQIWVAQFLEVLQSCVTLQLLLYRPLVRPMKCHSNINGGVWTTTSSARVRGRVTYVIKGAPTDTPGQSDSLVAVKWASHSLNIKMCVPHKAFKTETKYFTQIPLWAPTEFTKQFVEEPPILSTEPLPKTSSNAKEEPCAMWSHEVSGGFRLAKRQCRSVNLLDIDQEILECWD